MIRQGLSALGRKTTEGKFHFYHIYQRLVLSTWFIDIDVDLDLVKLLCLCSFPHHTLWKITTMHKFTLKEWGVLFPLVRADYLHKLFGILLHKRAVYWPPFIYIYSNNSISIDSRILICWVLSRSIAFSCSNYSRFGQKTISLNIYIQSLKISPLK